MIVNLDKTFFDKARNLKTKYGDKYCAGNSCPIALAVKHELPPDKDVFVSNRYIRIGTMIWDLTEKAQDIIRFFDNNLDCSIFYGQEIVVSLGGTL